MRLPTGRDETLVSLFNPLKEDFSVPYDVNGDKHPLEYSIASKSIETFPKYIADHVTKHLAQKIALSRSINISYEERYKKAVEEITVKL